MIQEDGTMVAAILVFAVLGIELNLFINMAKDLWRAK